EDLDLKREVAIKFLPRQISASEEEHARFKIEAQAAAALNHPNIATIFAIEEHDDEMFIVMEYIEGQELREMIRNSKFEIRNCLEIATQIAEGLQAAHEKGVIHRDIKPANIMVTEEGQVKIMDFGLAKVRGGAQITKIGTTLGTAAYMSPEQAQGMETDHRTDIWSFGVVLYEMLTGKLPFPGDYEQAVIYSILNEEPEFPNQNPAALTSILQKALTRNVDERYQRAEEMAMDLGKAGTKTVDKTARSAVLIRSKSSRIGITIVTAMLLSISWWFFKPASSESHNNSVAVLPFKNLNGEPTQDYFSDGMTETIISGLANISDLTVISSTSVMAYRDSDKSTRTIGRELNVGHILQGSVLISGEKVRIFAQLIDVETDGHLWAQNYIREITNIFSIQSDVASQIADVLKITLGTETQSRIEQRPTTDFEAYRLYLKGEFHFKKQTLTDIDTSIVLYEKAVGKDSGFAMAYTALASAYMWKYLSFDPNPEWEEKAYVAVQQAISLDSNLAEAYVVKGMIYWSPSYKFAHERALKEYEKAKMLKPGLSSAYQQLSLVQLHIGLLDKALITGRKSVELDPGNHRARRFVGEVLLSQGKYSQSLEIFSSLPETFAPSLTISLTAVNLYYLHRVGEAMQIIEKSLLKDPNDPQFNSSYAILLASLGRNDEARQRMVLAIENARDYIHIHHIYHNLAGASALMGEKEEAVQWLIKAAEDGFPSYPLFNLDPKLASLKGDPGFEAFLMELKQKWEYYKSL
ncbi:MAG: protein kinase, partial [bacterium]